MKFYDYETEQFGLSISSIHLLRNGFNYKTIDFINIDSIVIKKGKELKNWVWVLIVGLGLLLYVVFDFINICEYYKESFVIYIERLLIPLFPFFLGIYSVIIAFRSSLIMIVKIGNKNYRFTLRKFIKSNNYKDFIIAIMEYYPSIVIEDRENNMSK
jgi:hypothetical protein